MRSKLGLITMTWICLKGNISRRIWDILIILTRLRREGTRAHMGRWLHPHRY